MLTINASAVTRDRGGPLPVWPRGSGLLGSMGLALGGVLMGMPGGRRRRKIRRTVIAGMVLFGLLLPTISCGGGGSSSAVSRTPAAMYGTVTVQATGGGLINTATVHVEIY